ncbi:helix-turn-helix domain-containing protein, partial [Streptomyces chartreusis]|uniref:helix-turn-helix domain-containing protein n=1 Tax=Streptomyces chartreusis TaxID=1969 RepID=UPI0033AA1F79
MAGVLYAERVWVETFTRLHVTQFARLLKVVRERGGNGTLRGRPWPQPLAERVLMVAVHYRTNRTTRQLGPLFGVSSSTLCRVIQ